MGNVVEVVGTYYTDAEKILRNVVKDLGGFWNADGYQYHKLKLVLIPEPTNEHDSNAIAVYSNYPTPERARIKRSGKIGYLPRDTGVSLTDPVEVDATVKEGFKQFYVKIDIAPFISGYDNTTSNETAKNFHTNDEVNKFIFAALAIFLGLVGAHWFYAKQYKRGLLYFIFSWTTIPLFLGIYQGIKALLTPTDSTYKIKV